MLHAPNETHHLPNRKAGNDLAGICRQTRHDHYHLAVGRSRDVVTRVAEIIGDRADRIALLDPIVELYLRIPEAVHRRAHEGEILVDVPALVDLTVTRQDVQVLQD